MTGGSGGGPTTGSGAGGPRSGGGPGGPTAGDAPVPAGPTTPARAGSSAILDRDDWRYWWYANRAEILDLRARNAAAAARTGPAGAGSRAGEELWRAEAQKALAEALADSDADTVAAAAVALGKSGDASEGPALARMMLDRDRPAVVRAACAIALGLVPPAGDPAAPSLREALQAVALTEKESPVLRGSAVYGLGLRGEPESVPFLVDAARAGGATWDVPSAGLTALGLARCDLVRPELERLLSPPKRHRTAEFMRRVYAAHGLAKLGDAAAIPALAEAAHDEHPDVRRAALLAVAALAAPGGRAAADVLLVSLEEDPDRGCRNVAALCLARVGGPRAEPALRHAYKVGDAIHRPYAALGLGLVARRTGDAGIGAMLRHELAERSSADLRGALCIALGLARHAEAAPDLREIVTGGGDAALRAQAALAIALVGDAEQGPPVLRKLLAEKGNPDVQREAALALGLLGDRPALLALTDLVENGSSHMVQAAGAVALGRIGGSAASRVFATLLRDAARPAEVRESAAIGLGLLLDRREGRELTRIGTDLDWYATTEAVRAILDMH